MKVDSRRLLVLARIRRAQQALLTTASLLTNGSHVEAVETALVKALSEELEANRLLKSMGLESTD